jgi:hypothetical protein
MTMTMLTTEILADLNREHHAELVREAATMRLVRDSAKTKQEEVATVASAETPATSHGLLATLLALPGRFKMA